jgi:hypothetical protein
MSSVPPHPSLAGNPFGPRNARLVKTGGEANGLSHRRDDGDLRLRFVDGFDGLVILTVDRPIPSTEQRPLGATPRTAAPTQSRLRHRVQQFLSVLH